MAKLMAGYGETTITPPLGVELCGYGYYLNRHAEFVLDDLKVRAICLSRCTDQVLLISCDLIGFTVEFSDKVRQRIASESGIPADHILLACTHTHTGPASMPLEGCGEISPEYLATIPACIAEAARLAKADQGDTTLKVQTETIMPVGFNRRHNSFNPIDATLTTAIFDRPGRAAIYMLNYACHPVVLGPSTAVSADWPGRLIKALERRHHRGIFFQGFCGDINPACGMNRWGKGTEKNIDLYGEAMCQQMLLAEQYAQEVAVHRIFSKEQRIDLPLRIPDEVQIQKEHDDLLAAHKDPASMAAAERLMRAWLIKAQTMRVKADKIKAPIQTISLDDLVIIGLPGEVFCEYGLTLRSEHPKLFTIGYAGGNVGYLPTVNAYKSKGDYACFEAPKLYQVFSFQPDIEASIRQTIAAMLARDKRNSASVKRERSKCNNSEVQP